MDVMSVFDVSCLAPGDFEEVYLFVLKYLQKAQRDGLLALDEAGDDRSLPLIFRKGLRMVVDGLPPDKLLSRLSEQILKTKDVRDQTLGALYMQGLYSIQQGESSSVLKMRMAAPLGIEAMAAVIEEKDR